MLYWKDQEEFDIYQICCASRWKDDNRSGEAKVRSNGKKILVKIMCYFPLKPRLQRLFMSKKTASYMRWHHENRVDDRVMKHPANSLAWKSFVDLH